LCRRPTVVPVRSIPPASRPGQHRSRQWAVDESPPRRRPTRALSAPTSSRCANHWRSIWQGVFGSLASCLRVPDAASTTGSRLSRMSSTPAQRRMIWPTGGSAPEAGDGHATVCASERRHSPTRSRNAGGKVADRGCRFTKNSAQLVGDRSQSAFADGEIFVVEQARTRYRVSIPTVVLTAPHASGPSPAARLTATRRGADRDVAL
jgi:hypothetical protein